MVEPGQRAGLAIEPLGKAGIFGALPGETEAATRIGPAASLSTEKRQFPMYSWTKNQPSRCPPFLCSEVQGA